MLIGDETEQKDSSQTVIMQSKESIGFYRDKKKLLVSPRKELLTMNVGQRSHLTLSTGYNLSSEKTLLS